MQDPQVTRRYPADESEAPREGFVPGELPQVKPASGNIGPYTLLCELGAGGMGTVYVAQKPLPGGVRSTVALKTLKQQNVPRPNLAEMFLDEVRIIARISHPYVCAVRDLGMADGTPYVAMDYLIGEPLSRVLPILPQPPDMNTVACILRMVTDLCEGLHAAHELRNDKGQTIGVVHRDISPDNLFVLYDGSVRVVDFGIAYTQEAAQKGKAQTLAGKCAYMSPEQLRVKPLDRRSDVWSVGVVLWELLTGKRLFQRQSDLRTAVDVLGLPIDPPSKLNPLLPPALDALVMRALERDAEARIASARELSRELEALISSWFGLVPSSRVGQWLNNMFPGSMEFRRRIVTHSETLQQLDESGPQLRTRELHTNVLGAAESERAAWVRASLETEEVTEQPTNPEVTTGLEFLGNLAPPSPRIDIKPANDQHAKSLISSWLDEQSTPKFEAAPIQSIGKKVNGATPTISEPVEVPLTTGSRWWVITPVVLMAIALITWLAWPSPPRPSARVATPAKPAVEDDSQLMRAPPSEPPPNTEAVLRPEPIEPAPVVEPSVEPAPVAPSVASAPVTAPEAKPVATAEPKPAAAPEAKPERRSVLRGSVYVTSRDPTLRIVQNGNFVAPPISLTLPAGSQKIQFTRPGTGKISTVSVEIKPGTSGLISLD
ncbi:MAG TPA: protein kinase [Polyangiales bacterium]|nr:protein kinase [Polyangiales bacterium]